MCHALCVLMCVSRSVGVLMCVSRSVCVDVCVTLCGLVDVCVTFFGCVACTDQSDEPEDERQEDKGVGQQVATVGEPSDACPPHRHLHLSRPRRLPVHLAVLLHAHAQRGEADGGGLLSLIHI